MAIITISRGSFAGGRAVAQRLSERLKLPALSREDLLAQAAQAYGIRETDLAKALNQSPPFGHGLPGRRQAYVKCVSAVLLEHLCQGHLVYHGHVGHLLLADISHVLRVRVLANLEYRIAAAMEQHQLRREQAIAHIQRADEERSRWARFFYGVDWQDPTQYHALLNVSQMALESVVETIVRMSELEDFQPTPASEQRLSDLALGAQVWAALAKNPDTRSTALEVSASQGVVLIRGTAGSARALELIPAAAAAVPGVTEVSCEAHLGTDWPW
ncbi:MAG: BON domain-containing protein [Verrucomicrobia bacterium]|nr:BON domain-containing protein [Verrucomicrobiota bacterium]